MTTNAPARRRITGAALGLLLLGSTAAWSATQGGGTSTPEPTVVELAVAVVSEPTSLIEPAATHVDLNLDECELVDGLSGMGW